MADLKINIGATDNASGKVNQVATATERLAVAQGRMTASTTKATAASSASVAGLVGWGAALAAAVKVTQAATEAFLADEKSMTRLRFATGALADSFAEYASELQARTGADEDSTRAVQAMLYTYGVAPEVVNKATKALVDYATISGTDVKQAAEELIKGADGGREAFRELGLVYDEAATKTEMVANITEALTKKVGGASEADAGSLSSSVRRASAQFGELMETFGGFVALVNDKLGVLDRARITIGAIQDAISPSEFSQRESIVGEMKPLEDFLTRYNAAFERGDKNISSQDIDVATQYTSRLAVLQGKLDELNRARSTREAARNAALDQAAATKAAGEDGALTKKAREGREAARKKWLEDRAKLLRDSQKSAREVAEALAQGEDMQREATDKFLAEQEEAAEAASRAELENAKRTAAERNAIEAAAAKERDAIRQREADEARYWGDAIGGAFANALASQLNRLASGGELSPEETVVDVFTGIASVALSAAGAGWAAPLVGAAGSFAKSQLAKKHGGGWIGAPRFHNGAWIGQDERPAILQTGERVLSRSEVASMGGPRGVDSAARGAVSITVNTLDGSTARDYFTRAGGRALVNAVRTGRGSIGAFGRG